ncbi:hypothetical protein ACLBOM_36940 [Escherichia coli]
MSAVAARGITATAGNDCPGTLKVFACFWAKTFAGCTFHPWTGGDGCGCFLPPATGLKRYGMAPEGEGRKAPNNAIRRWPYIPASFAGMPGAQATARQEVARPFRSLQAGGFHASDRSGSPKPRQRVRRRLAGAPAAACRSRA